MQLQTVVDIKKELNINYHSKVLMFGSCFSEHIGNKLQSLKFSVANNPLGILFNPFSIAQTIQRIIEKRFFTNSEIFEKDGVWNSFYLHSEFAKLSNEEFLLNANQKLNDSHLLLKDCDYLFITLGTSWIYTLSESGEIVANCHKIPQQHFNRSRKSSSEIVNCLSDMIRHLRNFNPDINIVFTVSPIRHWKDGAHDNQLSKSSLLLSIDEIQNKFDKIFYFPAYEILMDELRDYRFYAEDMIHPNSIAINYIWERFIQFSFSKEVESELVEIEKVIKATQHKPFNQQSKAYIQFKVNTLQKIEQLQKKFPTIDFQKEREQLF